MANRVKTFEEQLTRLEEIVKLLDEGDLPLEKSLKLFEEGVSLARKCSVNLTDEMCIRDRHKAGWFFHQKIQKSMMKQFLLK